MFIRNKRDLAEKLEYERERAREGLEEKVPKSKEELLRQRKEMMRYKHNKSPSDMGHDMSMGMGNVYSERSKSPNHKMSSTAHYNNTSNQGPGMTMGGGWGEPGKSKKDPPPELLERLATGRAPKVIERE